MEALYSSYTILIQFLLYSSYTVLIQVISSYHKRKVKVSFGPKSSKKSKSPFKPFLQNSYRAEIKLIGGHFSRRIWHCGSKIHSSSKTARSWFDVRFFCKKCSWKFFSASKNEMSGIVWNAFSQSLKPNGAILGGKRPFEVLQILAPERFQTAEKSRG